MKVMIISPIRQNPEVLGLFLKSLSALAIQYRNQIEIAYYFADDNVERQSTALLYSFQKTMAQAPYQCDVFIARSESEHTDCVHDWTPQKILKMVHLRNGMIQAVRPMQWDFLLTIDWISFCIRIPFLRCCWSRKASYHRFIGPTYEKAAIPMYGCMIFGILLIENILESMSAG